MSLKSKHLFHVLDHISLKINKKAHIGKQIMLSGESLLFFYMKKVKKKKIMQDFWHGNVPKNITKIPDHVICVNNIYLTL